MPVRANVALYRGKFRNFQESASIFDTTVNRTVTEIRATGKGVVQGLETELTFRRFIGMQLNTFYAYTDVDFTENLLGGVNFLDQPFTNTPKHKAGGTLRYEKEIDGAGTISGSLNFAYQSRVYFPVPLQLAFGNPDRGQKGYSLLSARVDWNNVGDVRGLNLYAFGSNLTNRLYKVYENDSYDASDYTFTAYGEPRMYGVGLRYTF